MGDHLARRAEIKAAVERLEVGQRVLHRTEGVGIVEAKDLIFPPTVDVRWLTPNNEPSVLTSCVMDARDLQPVPDNVVPMPRSEEWWREAREFCRAIEWALIVDEQEGGES